MITQGNILLFLSTNREKAKKKRYANNSALILQLGTFQLFPALIPID